MLIRSPTLYLPATGTRIVVSNKAVWKDRNGLEFEQIINSPSRYCLSTARSCWFSWSRVCFSLSKANLSSRTWQKTWQKFWAYTSMLHHELEREHLAMLVTQGKKAINSRKTNLVVSFPEILKGLILMQNLEKNQNKRTGHGGRCQVVWCCVGFWLCTCMLG